MSMSKHYENNITSGPIARQILFFFFPIALGSFFQQFYNTADAIIVGRLVGKQALAAVGGTGSTIIQLFVGFFVGLSAGCSIKVSQNFGAGHDDKLNRCIHTAVAFSILSGIVISAVGFFITPWLVHVTRMPADTVEGATQYLRIYFLGMTGNLVYNMGASLLRALGDSKRPFYFLIFACILNILLDIVLVIPFRIRGAAYATILSQLISAFLVLNALTKNSGACRLELKKIRIHPQALKSMLRLGIATGFQSTMYSISNLLVHSSVNALGTNTAAGWAAYIKMDSIIWLINNSFSVSVTTFVGQNYGARNNSRIKKGIRTCFIMSVCSTLIFMSVFGLFGKNLLGLFTTDINVIDAGLEMLKVFVPAYIFWVPIDIYSGSLSGMGETVPPFIITGVGVCLFRILWIAIVIPHIHTITSLSLAYPVSWILTDLMYIVYFYCINKKRRLIYSLAKQEEAAHSQT